MNREEWLEQLLMAAIAAQGGSLKIPFEFFDPFPKKLTLIDSTYSSGIMLWTRDDEGNVSYVDK